MDKQREYDIEFNLPITLHYFDKLGMPKVILLQKKHIEYLAEKECEDVVKEYADKFKERWVSNK